MPRESHDVFVRIVGMEVIEKQEWIELRYLLKTECSLQMNTGPLDDWLALEDLTDFSSFTQGNTPY